MRVEDYLNCVVDNHGGLVDNHRGVVDFLTCVADFSSDFAVSKSDDADFIWNVAGNSCRQRSKFGIIGKLS